MSDHQDGPDVSAMMDALHLAMEFKHPHHASASSWSWAQSSSVSLSSASSSASPTTAPFSPHYGRLPQPPQSQKDILQKLSPLLQHLIPAHHPAFTGHMVSVIEDSVHMADLLISYLNQNLVKTETSGIGGCIEKDVLCWFHHLIYKKSEDFYRQCYDNHSAAGTLGMITSGGTMANLTALTIARNHALPQVQNIGMTQALQNAHAHKAVILTSQRAHYSIEKISAILGLGTEHCVFIPTDPWTQKISISKLQQSVNEHRSQGAIIVAIVAVASSTETGSVDDLEAIAHLCAQENIWMHVDAAWAGPYLFSSKLSPILAGIERAHSVVIDAHKLLGTTMGGGMVYFQNPHAATVIAQHSHYVLRPQSLDTGRFHLEGSRPFYALKIWILILNMGHKNMAARMEKTHEQALTFTSCLQQSPHFTQTTALETNILTYRWFPQPLEHWLQTLAPDHHPLISIVLHTIDRTQDHIHALGWQRLLPGCVSKTKLPCSPFPHLHLHITVLRIIPIHPHITRQHLQDLLQAQHQAAKDFFLEQIQHTTKTAEAHHLPLINTLTSLLQ